MKRFLVSILVVVLIASALPMYAYAAEESPYAPEGVVVENPETSEPQMDKSESNITRAEAETLSGMMK